MDFILHYWMAFAALCGVSLAHDKPDYHFSLGNLQRSHSYYVFTAPEVMHPGKTATIGVTLSRRLTNVLIHAKVVTWHMERVLARAEKFVPIIESDKPFLLQLKLPRYVDHKYGVLIIRMMQYPYKEERRIVRIMREKPKLFVRTNKGHYQPGESVEVWVLALDRYAMPYKGKVRSAVLASAVGDVVDYISDVPLRRGIASLILSTKNLVREGKHLLRLKVEDEETKILITIGKNSKDTLQDPQNLNYDSLSRPKVFPRSMQRSAEENVYSPSGSKIEILMQKSSFQVGSDVEAAVIYNNPTDGLNTFVYEVICGGKIHVHKKFNDIYSSWFCKGGVFRLWDKFDWGPSRNDMCDKKQTRFQINLVLTQNMYPECRFLVYKVMRDNEIIAATKMFKVVKEPRENIRILIGERNIGKHEALPIVVPKAAGWTMLLVGRPRRGTTVPEGMIAGDHIREYQKNGLSSTLETENMYTSCHGKDYVTAKQSFRNCGLKLVTNCNSDPEVPCSGRRVLRYSKSGGKDHPLLSEGENVTSWIWKKIDIPEWNQNWQSKIDAPAHPGTYILQAIFVSSTKGVDVAEEIEINVTDKNLQSQNDSLVSKKFTKSKKTASIVKHDITIHIVPNLSQRIFTFGNCQPLKVKICSRGSKLNEKNMYIVTMQMITSFYFSREDLERVRQKEKQLVMYIILPKKTMLFISRSGSSKECFSINLKQRGPYKNSESRAMVTYRRKRGKERSVSYMITEKDCLLT